ncbi:helix-turn-helix domain-containing protein [Chloroflexota bacterium]|nr:helix-turn-helix domain-containing protein [Chloroflexota bacterium]
MVEKYYTVEQIAEIINLHPKTIQRYIREGRLNAQKVGKAWRVSGHDLSVFLEEDQNGTSVTEATPGLQAIVGAARNEITVSAVIDIPVKNSAEAVQVVNWMSASLNSQSPEYGYKSFSSQYIDPEKKIRIMLWGSPALVERILHFISDIDLN